jgi:Protein tyrosine and serine/threonine kinase
VYAYGMLCIEILNGTPSAMLATAVRLQGAALDAGGAGSCLPATCPPAIASLVGRCLDASAASRPPFAEICATLHALLI